MIGADDTLRDLLRAGDPPARDPAFTAAVLQQVERRKLASDIAGLAPWAVAAGALLWAAAPGLGEVLRPLAPAAPILAVSLSCLFVFRRARLI